MIRYQNPKQLTITAFDWPFPTVLDEHNRWVTLSRCIPWEALATGYNQQFSRRQGRPAKATRLVIGTVIIKHKLNLSDRETIAQIQDDSMDRGGSAPSGTSAENPYLQYFVGLSGYRSRPPPIIREKSSWMLR